MIYMLILVAIGLAAAVVSGVRARRRVERLAADVGLVRMPGESSRALLKRCTRRLRGIAGSIMLAALLGGCPEIEHRERPDASTPACGAVCLQQCGPAPSRFGGTAASSPAAADKWIADANDWIDCRARADWSSP